MRLIKGTMAVAILVGLGAFAAPPEPAATLEFNKGYTAYNGAGAGRASSHRYWAISKPDCRRKIPVSMTWTTAAMISKPVVAERRVWLVANTRLLNSVSGGIMSRTCEQAAGFTPLTGHTYSITQIARESGCDLEVLDKATGAPPPDLVATETEEAACKAWLRHEPEGQAKGAVET